MKKVLVVATLAVAILGIFFILLSRGSLKMPAKKGVARLEAKPENIRVEVEEGGRTEARFELKNTGGGKALVNIYKTEESAPGSEISDEKISELLAQKNLNESAAADDLKKAADFTGALWLIHFPYYGIIEPGESLQIKLTIEAKELPAGSHNTKLIALGIRKEELEVIPVEVTVKQAPKVKISKIEIDDGFSEDTSGDQNHVANPGEKAALIAHFSNEGGVSVNGVAAELTFEDSAVKNVGSSVANISSIGSGETQSARFLFEAGGDVSPLFPPIAFIKSRDRSGKEWTESFYLGEEGAFDYPTGLTEPELGPEPLKSQP